MNFWYNIFINLPISTNIIILIIALIVFALSTYARYRLEDMYEENDKKHE